MPGRPHSSRFTTHRVWEHDHGGMTHGAGSWTPRPAVSLTDAVMATLNLKLRCPQCGYERVLDTAALLWLFDGRGWDDRLAEIPRRFRCGICWRSSCAKVRPLCAFVADAPTGAKLPLPDEREWKRFMRRLRS